MKKINLLILLTLAFILKAFSQPANDPRRGIYVDKFVNYSGSTYLNSFSILGVDADLNGVFEKEEELLQFAEQNHITSLTLYDVAKIFDASAPLVWNNNLSRYATLKEHLCRFMDRARNFYCIKEIYVAVGSTQEANTVLGFNQIFNTPTLPFQFTQAEMSSTSFNQRLSSLALQYPVGDPMLVPSEVAKFVLRALHFSSGNCSESFDGFTTEFEFWNNGLAQNNIDAGAFETFMTDIDLIKANYNSTHTPAISVNVYYGKKAANPANVTCPSCPAKYVDGCTSSCTGTCNYCTNLPPNKLGDRVYFELYYRSTSQLTSYTENLFRDPTTTNGTDLHPLFSVENKIGGAPVDFFGRWILDGFGGSPVEPRNIFQAEKEHYVGWKNNNDNGLVSENVIVPGGYEWFTSSYLLSQFKNPPLFYSNAPLCNNGSVDFIYIGPRERNIQYSFSLKDKNGSTVSIINGTGLENGNTPDFSVNQSDFLPSYNLVNSLSPYTSTLTLDFGQGCDPKIYTEQIVVGSGSTPTISALGYNTPTISICEGGQVILKASGGTGYSWKKNSLNISGATSQYYIASDPGVYTCNATGCGAGPSNPITITNELNPHVFITSLCNTPGVNQMTLTVDNSGIIGSNPGTFQYNWSDGETGSSIVISGTNHRSNYYVYATNIFNQCQGFNSISIPSTLPSSAPFSISAGNITCTNGLGSAVLTLNQITPHLPYDVNNDNMAGIVSDGVVNRYITWFSASNITVNNLPAGHYNVLANDNGAPCTAAGSFDIGNSNTFTIANATITNATCNGSINGAINITGISGGTAPYSFEWVGVSQSNISNSLNSSVVTNLAAGVYTLKITDQACNFQYINYIITEPNGLNVSSVIQPINCNGQTTGSIDQTITGAGLSYSWNSGQLTQDINGIPAGLYICTITQNGCSEDFNYLVNQNPAIGLDVVSTTSTCTSNSIAEIRIYGGVPITSGNADYNVSSPWTLVSVSDRDEFQITGQNPGNHSISITDILGCTYNSIVNIPTPPAVIVTSNSQINVLCNGGNTGSASVTTSGGTPPFTYSWTGSTSTSATASNLIAGNYICTVTDNVGCTGSSSVTITEPSPVVPTISSQTNAACFGGNNGKATAAGIGGTSPYTYSWNTAPVQTTAQATGLSAGTYVCTVADNNSCTGTVSITITAPTPVLPTISSQTNVSCFGGSNGKATAAGNGGTSPYTYSWNTAPVQTTAQATGLSAGTYVCTVTDNNSCTGTVSVTISQPTQISIGFQNISNPCIGGSSGSITGVAFGGTTSYSYSWNTVPIQNTAQATGLTAGTYIVTVSDGNGCIITGSYTLTENLACCGNAPQIISAPGNLSTLIPYSGSKCLNYNATVASGTVIFSGLNLSIAAGVTITINSGATLRIEANSHLYACGDMWSGIINNGTIIVDNSTIEDALNAVFVNRGITKIDHSYFNHNDNGVVFNTGTYLPTQSWIRSTIFDCTDGEIGKQPRLHNLSSCHVKVQNVDYVKIGNELLLSDKNTFHNARVGLSAIASNIEVYNNLFENIHYPHNFPIHNCAISVSQAIYGNFAQTVQIGSNLNFGSNTINDWSMGISLEKLISASVQNNLINLTNTGIYETRCAIASFDHNTINRFRFGIQCYDNVGQIQIKENTFDLIIAQAPAIKNTAIRVENPSSYALTSLRIELNTIWNSTTGILCRNVPKAIVGKGNHIYMIAPNSVIPNFGNFDAISLQNCEGAYALLNEIYRFENPDPALATYLRGISIDNTKLAYLYGNNVRKMGQGIRFFNYCDNTELHCNVMLDDYNGVYFDQSSQTDQGINTESWDNYWNNQIDNSWMRVDGQNSISGQINWYYNSNIDQGYSPAPHWSMVLDIDNTPKGECPDPTLVQLEPTFERDLELIALNQKYYSDFEDEMDYENKDFFYNKVSENPNLLTRGVPEDLIFQTLFNELRTGNIGLLSEVRNLLKQNDYAQAYIKNLSIIDENLIETNKKIVNDILIRCKMNDTLPDSTMILNLTNIAYQYPLAGGEAVYWARAILHLDIEDIGISLRKRPKGEVKNASYSIIYPNPAKDIINFRTTIETNSNSILEIKDEYGRAIKLVEMNKGIHELSIPIIEMPNGIYFYSLKSENKVLDFGRFVIIK